MNRPDRPTEAPQLDPLAQKLLAIDEALEQAVGGAVETPRHLADSTVAGLAVAQNRVPKSADVLAGQCLQWIEAIRVTAPDRLEAAFQSGSIHSQPTLAVDATTPTPSLNLERDQTRIGRFQLIRRLGQGGYGVVFLAHDPTLHRDVALKVPRPEVLVTADLRRRFLREAEAAAALDHPHIVSVYEAGTVGPVSYIASAYCPGASLSQWLQERGQVMSPRQAAEIMATLAGAVQHAHDRGVLHRDIKPGNVLIEQAAGSDDGSLARSVQLTDFGLARVTAAPSDESMSLGIVGTPAYMAPEQAANRREEIGPATDVYGLGATLYHLLTGRPPIVGSSQIETLAAILAVEPVEPSHYRSDIPRDLSAICMKALEKETPRRYATALELQADLERFLRGEQVVARPVSQLQRAGKWCRRNPVVAALGAIASAAVLTALVVALAGWWSTSQALQREKSALIQADSAYEETKQAVEKYYVTITQNELLDAPGATPLRKELLTGALEYYTRFVNRHKQDADAVEELCSAYVRIADVHEKLGEFTEAQAAYEEVLALAGNMSDERDAWKRQFGLGTIHRKLSRVCRRTHKLDEALDHAEQSLTLHRGLIEQAYCVQDNQYQVAQALGAKASVLNAMGRTADAVELYQKSESLLERLLAQPRVAAELRVQESHVDFDDTELRLRLAQVRGNRSIMLQRLGRLDESKPILEAAAEIYRGLAADAPEVATYRENLGKAHANLSLYGALERDFEASLRHLREATDIFDSLAADFPRVTMYETLRASTRKEAALQRMSIGQWHAAERLLEETVEIFERIERKSPELVHVDLADARMSLGQTLLRLSRLEQAKPLIDAATTALEQQLQVTPNEFITRTTLALVYERQAEWCLRTNAFDEAVRWLDKSSDLLTSVKASMPANRQVDGLLANNQAWRATAFERQGLFEQAIAQRRQVLTQTHDNLRNTRQLELAITLARCGDLSEAEALLAGCAPEMGREWSEWLALARLHAILGKAYAQQTESNVVTSAEALGSESRAPAASADGEQQAAHHQRALNVLRQAVQMGVLDGWSPAYVEHDDFAELREVPGFEELFTSLMSDDD